MLYIVSNKKYIINILYYILRIFKISNYLEYTNLYLFLLTLKNHIIITINYKI